MGAINRFDLNTLIHKYKIDYFFETGTWRGDGLVYAAKFPFKKLFSCEIMEEIFKKTSSRFSQNKNIELYKGSSEDALKSLNEQIQGNCIFWLDAHYPGAEEGLKSYNETDNETLRLPLHIELLLLKKLRSGYNDVILIDDLRIYEDGPYKGGNMPDNIIPPSIRNVDFADELFSTTHEIIKSYEDHGYLIIVPKKSEFSPKKIFFSKFYARYIKRFVYP